MAPTDSSPVQPNNVPNSELKNALFIIAGVVSAAFGLKSFLLSSHFIDGGVTGVSMLLATAFRLPLSILILVINLPFIALGYNQLGRRFALRSALGIGGLALVLALVPFPDVTPDRLLTAVFGGVFIGAGIGLAMRGGAVLDGTEIAALLVSRYLVLLKVSDLILILNVVIFGVAVLVLGTEPALYSMLTYFAAARVLEFVLNGIEQYTGVTIVSEYSDAIRKVITEKLGRGVTMYQGKSGYGKRGEMGIERDIVFTVVTRLELPALRTAVQEVDPRAFIVQYRIDDAQGGIIKKRALH
ncbi:YitT family protein [Hymenobacter convexus]|uniref:YitT family protein n=1 Tax=Hymenobacter sp. CA1UV-4 TaxID=3063782 RepID=UPI002714396B|nr:YitT family protein [Hymenobacter sp. CA1UV-4]MDO7853760.1 YitT family protein [Hymenobacter sp. CA1UV-4]